MKNLIRFGKLFGFAILVIMSLAWLNDIRTAPETSATAIKARLAAYIIDHGARSAYARGGVGEAQEFCDSFGLDQVLSMYVYCDVVRGGFRDSTGHFETQAIFTNVYANRHDAPLNLRMSKECRESASYDCSFIQLKPPTYWKLTEIEKTKSNI